jgi:hypothetical protein
MAVAIVAGPVACTSGPEQTPGAQGQQASSAAPSGSPTDLHGVCPDTVVIQTNWWPQAEYGALYRLLGGATTEDTDHKTVTGELIAAGVDTGVRLRIASGGPANSYTPAAKVLYLDDSVTLAGADVDQAVQYSGGQPVQAVFAPMERSPVVLMWDPATLPGVHTIADLGRAGTRVLYFTGSAYMDYLVGSGALTQGQIDSSYDGTPARFVAENGTVAQQGYLTNEVYQYQHELPQWNRPVAWQLVDDLGYPNYPEAMVVRPDRKAALAGCLARLVPMLQRAAAAYLADPGPTNDLISKLVTDFGGFPYSRARADNAVAVMTANKIMGAGPDGAVGSFDLTRVQRVIDIDRPIDGAHGTAPPAGLTAAAVATNEFIDRSVTGH